MNKKEMIDAIAKKAGISKKAANEAIDAMIEGITTSLKKNKPVTLIGFGTFSVKNRKARKGINPQTKEVIKIKAKRVPHFKPGAKLKDAVK
ncbi:MAG: HU family DNA-binding protein [candidate division WOR-3 bacterium]